MRAIRRKVVVAAGGALLLLLAATTLSSAATSNVPAGPPYPDPVTGQRVYDYAGIFSPGAIASAEQTIRQIETRTGAQVAVYTQVKPQSDSLDKANADALALMNQWGVGRKGFDDGLVILFDMQSNLRHGQVSLYAGSGFKAAFLSNADRQSIFDNDMLPLLKAGNFDGALANALSDVNTAATPEHAASLSQARFLNAAVGIGAAGLAIWLLIFALVRWYTHGRDPIYIDDSSVLMPAPPDGLTPAMATLVMDDRISSRTMSAALIDLAARGVVHFRQSDGFMSHHTEIGGVLGPDDNPPPPPVRSGNSLTWLLSRKYSRLGVSTPESSLGASILAFTPPDGYIRKESMRDLAGPMRMFKDDLESLAVSKGWLTAKPSQVRTIWTLVAVAEFIVAAVLFWWTVQLDASGGLLGGAAMVVAAIGTLALGWIMPSRTPQGSMLRAMLAAYGRTLRATLAMSNTMDEVVQRKPLPWVETPDQEMAWGVALGLNDELDRLLHRTMDATAAQGAVVGWYPLWWSTPGRGFGGAAAGGSASGLYSASAIPDVGSMVSALGSFGSTASGGGGGFGGGGGGGGGGAGGGF